MSRIYFMSHCNNIMVLVWLLMMLVMQCDASTNNKTSNISNVVPQKFNNPKLLECDSSSAYLSANRDMCCDMYYEGFARAWYGGGYYLTTYLTTLKNWKCDQYNSECENPVYDFTPFTKLVYQSFCDRNRLFDSCVETLYRYVPKKIPYVNSAQTTRDEELWRNLATSLMPLDMSIEILNEPCVQIALFDRPFGGVGRFHEMCEPFTLFGDITWVGYDMDTAMERDISPWSTYSIRIKSSLTICFLVTAVLSIAVIAANIIVLAVYTTTAKLRNSQAIYKINVASSDLMSGLIVIPGTIVFGYFKFCVPRKMGEIVSASSDITYRLAGGGTRSVIPTAYIDALGFFTTLTLTTSVYTLLIASCDRLWAIFRPLSYNKSNAKTHSKIACCVICIVALFISTIPFMIKNLMYKLNPVLMVTSVGDTASILLSVAFGLPLIVICVTNIMIFRSAKKHAKVRKKLRTPTKKGKNVDDMERRLSKVLGLMVGVFVACVLPTFATVFAAAAFNNIVFPLPEQLDLLSIKIYHSLGYCFGIILLSNSLWNCLIYSVRGTEFRKAVRSLRAIRIAGSTVDSAISTMRRLSAVTVVYYRRKSSAGTTDTSSSSGNATRVTMHSENSIPSQHIGMDPTPSKEYYPISNHLATISHSATDTHQAGDKEISLSTFDSYAIDAGADRLYLSVMENIEET